MGSPGSASRRMFSRRRPITAGRCPSASRLSPRNDRRATWSASPPLRRPSPRRPGRTSSVPPAGVESPPHPRTEGGRSGSHPNVPVGGQAGERSSPMPLALPPLCRTAVWKTTLGGDSQFGPPRIHTFLSAYPQVRQRLTSRRPARPLPNGPLGRWLERPPSPRAWYGIGAVVFHKTAPCRSGVAPAPSIPAGRQASSNRETEPSRVRSFRIPLGRSRDADRVIR